MGNTSTVRMYIIPFYTKKKDGEITNTISLTVAWVFMKNGGKQIWKTEKEDESIKTVVQEYLVENGFIGNVRDIVENCLFYEIDTQKTKMDNFYRWLEDESIDETVDIWRPWFFFTGSNELEYHQIKVLRDTILKV